MFWFLPYLLLSLVGLAHCLSSSGNRLLVVIEDSTEQEKYSQFWGDLNERGFSLTFESPKSDKFALLKHGVREFDHLILLPPKSKGYGPSLTPKILLDFVKENGNILLALSGEAGTPSAIASLLLEIDIHIPSDRTTVTVDHFNYDAVSANDKHDVLLLPRPSPPRSDIKSFFGGEGVIAFPRAVAQTLENSSPLLASILSAKSTAYSYNPKEEPDNTEDPFATGEQISLVTAMQARNSARFTVFGSLEALENKWFDAKVQTSGGKKTQTANRAFAKQVSEWTFMESGVLKVGKVEHHLAEVTKKGTVKVGNSNPPIYRVKNDVTFNVELSEYTSSRYSPLNLPADDAVQLEFTMLSPYQRLSLKPTSKTENSTVYSTTFTAPDQHGIFSFRVNYKRPFLTNVEIKEEVTVRHFAHDEYPRSWLISGGWVWIAGIWVTVAGWIGFVALWLWSAPAGTKLREKKSI